MIIFRSPLILFVVILVFLDQELLVLLFWFNLKTRLIDLRPLNPLLKPIHYFQSFEFSQILLMHLKTKLMILVDRIDLRYFVFERKEFHFIYDLVKEHLLDQG